MPPLPTAQKLIVCYALGTGAGFDLNLAPLGRQICEDFAELLALNEKFITIPQMILVRQGDEPAYAPEKNACAFAVFYSLPETRWVLNTTRAIQGDIALTGRIVDDETGLLLSVNLLDVQTQNLLFCGYETCARMEIHLALQKLAARILAAFTDRSRDDWMPQIREIIGTSSYHAYINWMNVRETERRAHREGIPVPLTSIVENLTYALSADPDYTRASLRLCDIMANQLPRQSYEFILRYLEPSYNRSEALSLIIVQCYARLGRRSEAEACLGRILEKHPQNGLFHLMRGCIATDERLAARDLESAKQLLGNDFSACRTAVDNALVNVTGI